MNKKNTFLRGFVYAFRGIRRCIREERNFRFHMVAAVYVCLLAPSFLRSRAEGALLALTIGLVLCAEAVNTAIERLVNRISPEQHPLAGAAKDIAAGAVLLTAVAAVAVAVFLFGRWETWVKLFTHWYHTPIKPLLLILSAIPAVLFIVKSPSKEMFQ